jgi:hypothetical protein
MEGRARMSRHPDYIRQATGRLEIQDAVQVGDRWCG